MPLLAGFPNVLADDVPDGPDEHSNVELRRWGQQRNFAFDPRPHDEVGAGLGMDFAAAAKLSGARFVVLRRQLAALERALGQFMLDLQTREHGYTEVAVPYLVRDGGAVRHRPAAQDRRGPVPDHDRPLPHPDRRGPAHQSRRRRDRRREPACRCA